MGAIVFGFGLQLPNGQQLAKSGDASYLSFEYEGTRFRGAARMALLVEFADRGDELDHANWLNARLVK